YGIIQMVIDGFCFVIYMLPYLIFCPGQTGGTFCLDAKSTQKNQDRKKSPHLPRPFRWGPSWAGTPSHLHFQSGQRFF
ncbi:MAG: hypothetical protein ACNS62_12545, partial [Candidatus Cyclobacteriaceae bacterium M3_2C_046]